MLTLCPSNFSIEKTPQNTEIQNFNRNYAFSKLQESKILIEKIKKWKTPSIGDKSKKLIEKTAKKRKQNAIIQFSIENPEFQYKLSSGLMDNGGCFVATIR